LKLGLRRHDYSRRRISGSTLTGAPNKTAVPLASSYAWLSVSALVHAMKEAKIVDL